MYFASSFSRIFPYAYYKSLPWALLSGSRTHSYCKGHRCFAIEVCFAREFWCSHPWRCVVIIVTWRLFFQSFTMLKYVRKKQKTLKSDSRSLDLAPAQVVLTQIYPSPHTDHFYASFDACRDHDRKHTETAGKYFVFKQLYIQVRRQA